MLQGKRALVVGVANSRSIAWGVAQAWAKAGAEVHIACQARQLSRVQGLAAEIGVTRVSACDLRDDAQVAALSEDLRSSFGHVDSVLHSVAYASPRAMQGSLLETQREDFAEAMDVSSYSFLTLARHTAPLLSPAGASLMTVTFLGATSVVPSYNVMGVAKASLEALVRGLAWELGPRNVTVNALSPGPVNTVSARGIKDFVGLKNRAIEHTPLSRSATIHEVGEAATFLAGDGARSITGQVLMLDGGLSAMAPVPFVRDGDDNNDAAAPSPLR